MTAPTGPFRNVGLSKAAQTHRLRKLRAPSKCRECNSYVYFQGAECEEVTLGEEGSGWNGCRMSPMDRVTPLLPAPSPVARPQQRLWSSFSPGCHRFAGETHQEL